MSDIPKAVDAAISQYPPALQKKLRALRRIILSTAKRLDIGELEETLKWSEPAYLPKSPRTGTTVRIGVKITDLDNGRLFVNCQTTLIQTYKTLFPEFDYEGNRGVLFDLRKALPEAEIGVMVEAALTYHQKPKSKRVG